MLRRGLLALLVTAVPAALIGTAASAAAAPPAGHLMTVVQNTFEHRLLVTGWAYDPSHMTAPVTVKVYVDGKYAGHSVANLASPTVDRTYHLRGNHDYSLRVTWTPTAKSVTAKAFVANHATTLATKTVSHYLPSPGSRIITVAKRYIGHSPYREGGASPSGFDCSGYTKYVYAQAHIATLPHNAEQQRHVHGMRTISAHTARAGDLVFYLSGGSAYHVAIYAGHGMQYAAATPQDGLRYQHVWSSAVVYGTDWH